MAAQDIPATGEVYLGHNPAAERAYMVTVAAAAGAGIDVVLDAEETQAIFNVAAGWLITKVICMVKTAWTTSVTLTIGDGDSAAGFLASADIAPQTDDDTAGIPANSLVAGEAYAGGRYYGAADTIDMVAAGATPSAGNCEVLAFGVPMDDID
jgi:hypothetical protein